MGGFMMKYSQLQFLDMGNRGGLGGNDAPKGTGVGKCTDYVAGWEGWLELSQGGGSHQMLLCL